MSPEAQAREAAYRDAVVGAIRKLVASNKMTIPASPTQAVRLLQTLDRDDYAIEEVIELVKSDQALSAQVLRHAGSAMNGTRRSEVSSLERAIALMGVEQLARLVSINGVHAKMVTAGPLSEVRRTVWTRTVMRAQTAELLAKLNGMRSSMAFLCGLLCDFGKVATIRAIEQILVAQPTAAGMPLRFWMGVIQACEAEVGLKVAEQWELPDTLQAVMRLLLWRQTDGQPLVELVLAADRIAGLIRTQSVVTPPDLADILHSEAHQNFLLSSIPKLLDTAARMSPETPYERPTKSKVTSAPEAGWTSYAAHLNLDVKRSAGPIRYLTMAVAHDGVEMEGREPLPTQELIRIVVHAAEGELSVFGTVLSCTPVLMQHRIVLRFFAMPREMKTVWDGVVQSARLGIRKVSA